jgi:hypothetical protein
VRALIDTLNARFAAVATGRNVLLVFVATLLALSLFGVWLVPAFQAVTGGMYPIDMSFPTTPTVIYNEYAAYTAASRQIYRWFFLVDFFWPPLLATFFAIMWTWLAGLGVNQGGGQGGSQSAARAPQRLLGAGILLLPYAEAALDVLENIGFLTLLESYPKQLITLAWATSVVKHTKLVLYLFCWLTTALFAGYAVASAAGFSRPARK